MKNNAVVPSDGHEAARLLDAYLRHIETARERRHKNKREKIVLVLPDAEVAERTRNAVPTAPTTGGKKRAKTRR